ncbi:hypothetical protein PYCC9005_000462 [Savitreella phatthalungensis]
MAPDRGHLVQTLYSNGSDEEDIEEIEMDARQMLLPAATNQSHASKSLDGTLSTAHAVLERSLANFGFGRYQRYVFAVCGLGYMLDLLWASSLGLSLPVLTREISVRDSRSGDISSSFSVGLTFGAISWGILIDLVGRPRAFNATVAIATAAGILLPLLAHSLPTLCALAFLLGIGIGGNIPVDSTVAAENLPRHTTIRRLPIALVTLLSIFQPAGTLLCTVIARAVVPGNSCKDGLPPCGVDVVDDVACCASGDNWGWRWLMVVLAVISGVAVVVRSVCFDLKESPRYLLAKGRNQEALQVIRHIARFNGVHLDLSPEEERLFEHDGEPLGTNTQAGLEAWQHDVTMLFRDGKLRKRTLTTWVVYGGDFLGFSLAGFLPYLLARRGLERHDSLANIYTRYMPIYAAGVPAAVAVCLVAESRQVGGRRGALVITGILYAVPLMLFGVAANSDIAVTALSASEYAAQTMFNAILYAATPDLFPPQVRGTAGGLASTIGRLVTIVAPLIGGLALEIGGDTLPLYMAGTGVLIATTACLWLPGE